MDNIQSTTISINNMVNGILTNENFRHIYDIVLEKNKYYFITLISKDDTEFNLRIYDSEKNIIKLKGDDNEENIYIADLNNNIKKEDEEDEEDEDDEEDDESDDDDDESEDNENEENNNYQDLNNPEMLNNFILDIIGKSISNLNQNMDDSKDDNEDANKIEIIIEVKDDGLPNENDLKALLKNNEISNNVIINYNNKMYFTPENTGKYYLSVTSDYNYQEGEYSLNIQEVEDIKVTYNNNIELNDLITFKAKDKFKSKKYFIDLKKEQSYKIDGSENLKFLISGNKQKIISKNNIICFTVDYNTTYEIEVMSLKKGIKGTFQVLESNKKEISKKIIRINYKYPFITHFFSII